MVTQTDTSAIKYFKIDIV